MKNLLNIFTRSTIIFLQDVIYSNQNLRNLLSILQLEKTTVVDVKVNLKGIFTAAYPKNNDDMETVEGINNDSTTEVRQCRT